MQFSIRERVISQVDDQLIGDNADYTATFDFDEEWAGKVKTARFIHNGRYADVMLEGSSCTIPVEVLKHGFVNVGVFTSEMTTTFCEVYVRESIKEKDGSPVPPSYDVYAQIIDRLEDIEHGVVPPAEIEEAVNRYLDEHPIEGVEIDDAVASIEKGWSSSKTAAELAGKVDAIEGKGLSSNDYTDADKQKVAAALTEHQSLAGYATTAYVDNMIGGALNGNY